MPDSPIKLAGHVTHLFVADVQVVLDALQDAEARLDRSDALYPGVVRSMAILRGQDTVVTAPTLAEGAPLLCPKCGGTGPFRYVEEISCCREVEGMEDGVLVIEGHYDTDGFDDGDCARLVCGNTVPDPEMEGETGYCGHEFPVPENVPVDFR